MERADNVRIALDNLASTVQENNYGDISYEILQGFVKLYSAVAIYELEVDGIKRENAMLRKMLVEKFG